MKTFCFRGADYNQEYGNKYWLYINNYGYYFNISRDITTHRPIPRLDYHLLYVSNGEVCVNGHTIKNGDAYLILSHEPHTYTYKKLENSKYYWIHFTGNKVEEILKSFDLSQGMNKDNECSREKERLLDMIAEELSKCSDEASEYAATLFFSFLSLFKTSQKRKRFYERAIKELECMGEDVSIERIADSYNISASHFIRSFKRIYKVTPNEYRQNYRLSQARNLLAMTNLPIRDIASQCGFSDSFYFSRFFKQRVGISPSEYRSNNSEKN